jgi:copper chaperone
MKHLLVVFLLLSLSACATSEKIDAHQGLSCSTAQVSGMMCEACASTISTNLKKLDGVKDVVVDVASGTVNVYADPTHIPSTSSVKKIVEHSGYQLNSYGPHCPQ